MEVRHQRGEANRGVRAVGAAAHDATTVWLVAQDDGSWLIEGVGEPVLLSREAMLVVAESVLRHEEGRSPAATTGRPEVGNVVHVRLGEVAAAVDAYAAEHWMSRAQAVCELVADGLDRATA
ncbi:MAG: hypothetical protein ACRDSF_23300 [Pseudonocardiaceae bacterium]